MAKRKRLTRHVKVAGRETPAERQARTAVRFILDNPNYPVILKAIRSGTPNSKIAEFCISRGLMEVNQKTAVSYLQYFRKQQPALCKPQPDDRLAGYDHIIDGNALIMDEETELLRLIALQKSRLGIAFDNERSLNVLMGSANKEVEVLRNLLMDLAKLRGVVGNTMDVNFNGYSTSVKDDLKGIQQDEHKRNVIATLVSDLVGTSDGA